LAGGVQPVDTHHIDNQNKRPLSMRPHAPDSVSIPRPLDVMTNQSRCELRPAKGWPSSLMRRLLTTPLSLLISRTAGLSLPLCRPRAQGTRGIGICPAGAQPRSNLTPTARCCVRLTAASAGTPSKVRGIPPLLITCRPEDQHLTLPVMGCLVSFAGGSARGHFMNELPEGCYSFSVCG